MKFHRLCRQLYLLLFCYALLCLPASLRAQAFTLLLDGAPAAADTATHTLYCPIEEPADTACFCTVRWDNGGGNGAWRGEKWNGRPVSQGERLLISNWRRPQQFTHGDTLWSVVLTTLPVVALELDGGAETVLKEEQPARLRIVDLEERSGDSLVFQSACTIKLRGATAAVLDKKSLTISLKSSGGGEAGHPLDEHSRGRQVDTRRDGHRSLPHAQPYLL